MSLARARFGFLAWSLAVLAVASSACGGRSPGSPGDGGDDGTGGLATDGGNPCVGLACPAGWSLTLLGGQCGCVLTDTGPAGLEDAPSEPPDAMYLDATYYESPDASYYDYQDASPEPFPVESGTVDGPFCPFFGPPGGPPVPPGFCPNGYVLSESCQCISCTNSCPIGQTPGPSCNGCVACNYACPAGFDAGPSCGCVPHGTDAGNPPPPADSGTHPADSGSQQDGGSGVTCLLQGYTQCAAGSWCELGICPDNKTQYGCFCNADGTATCDVNCPRPPDCTIPGEGDCPYGAQCVYGSCSGNSSSDLFICSCGYGGSASCYTASCADGGPSLGDAGNLYDGSSTGTTCLLEGYDSCPAGSFCSLGTCPDGTTQYGCTCNADGTATCNLTCPIPPPCEIPGEGTCPSETQCTFGTCEGDAGTQLYCNCYQGTANCYTSACNGSDAGGVIMVFPPGGGPVPLPL